MANSFIYKNKSFSIGSTVNVTYKFKEGQKEHKQIFKGILMKIKAIYLSTLTVCKSMSWGFIFKASE